MTAEALIDRQMESVRALARNALADLEARITPFIAELREAQAKIDADPYDYGDTQKGEAADLIEALFAHLKHNVDDM